MAKPYCPDFKIITAIVQVPKFFRIFAVNVADFNLAHVVNIVEEDLSSVNNVEHLDIILGKPKP